MGKINNDGNFFLVHEIERIDGGKVFQNSGISFRFGENIFYDQKTKILIKIPAEKRSWIEIIAKYAEFQGDFPIKGMFFAKLFYAVVIDNQCEMYRYCVVFPKTRY